MKIAETTRLIIREVERSDLQSLACVLSDREVMRYSFRGVRTPQEIEAYIIDCQANYKAYGFGQWAVIEKKSANLIGVCGLNPGFDGDENIIHFAARYAVDYWGKGFASETLVAAINYAKTSLNLNNVYALVEPENLKSIQLVLHLGFQFQKQSVYKERALRYYNKLL